jgi:hypothetical protein
MDVFRFAKLPPRANDPTRRYQLVHGADQRVVGRVELDGDSAGDAVHLTITCHQDLSDAARQDALDTARRFVEELAAGWGRQVVEGADVPGWEQLPDGMYRTRLEFAVV